MQHLLVKGKERSKFDEQVLRIISYANLNFVNIPNRVCNLGVSFIIDKTNYTKIYQFSKLMKSIGVDSIKLSGCVVATESC